MKTPVVGVQQLWALVDQGGRIAVYPQGHHRPMVYRREFAAKGKLNDPVVKATYDVGRLKVVKIYDAKESQLAKLALAFEDIVGGVDKMREAGL